MPKVACRAVQNRQGGGPSMYRFRRPQFEIRTEKAGILDVVPAYVAVIPEEASLDALRHRTGPSAHETLEFTVTATISKEA